MIDPVRFAAGLVEEIKTWIEPAFASISARFEEFEKRLKAIPAGPKGEKGDTGESVQGEKGDAGERGKDGAQGERGAEGAQGVPGDAGEPGAAGPAGQKGDAGPPGVKGDAGPAGAQGERGAAGEHGERGEKGEPGDRGADGPAGPAGMHGKEGAVGARGEKGEPGIAGAPGSDGREGKDGRDGREGKDGAPGRDALEIDILPGIEESKSYPRGTFAEHRGGVIRAIRNTDPITDSLDKAGWVVSMNGIADFSEEILDEGRTIKRTTFFTGGRAVIQEFKTSMVLYRGVWREGEFQRGDVATWSGCSWHCEKTTSDKPGTSDAWKMMVKSGRDGKDGKLVAPPAKETVKIG